MVIFVLAHAFTAPSAADSLSKERLLGAQSRLSEHLVFELARDPKRKGTDNIIVSPASLAGIMAILDIGADNKMRGAIFETLGFNHTIGHEPGADLAALRETVGKTASDKREDVAKFTIANSVVFDPKSQPYEKAIAQIRRAGANVEVAPLSDPATIKRINDWVSAQTKGLIPSILDGPLPPGIVGLNAIYFNGQWTTAFDKRRTEAQTFFSLNSDVQVPMMSTERTLGFRKDGRFVAIDIPYKGERFAFTVVTTTDAKAKPEEFTEVSGWLTADGFEKKTVQLSLPRFKLEGNETILNAAKAMGLSKGMDSATAFEGLSPLPQNITDILQRAYLDVNEESTEAAAVTSVIIKTLAIRPNTLEPEKVVVDHPFLFALRDNETGLILISGYISKPDSGPVAELANPKK
jgi:serpin B